MSISFFYVVETLRQQLLNVIALFCVFTDKFGLLCLPQFLQFYETVCFLHDSGCLIQNIDN